MKDASQGAPNNKADKRMRSCTSLFVMAAFPTAATNERVFACVFDGGAEAMHDVVRQDKKKRIRVMIIKSIFFL